MADELPNVQLLYQSFTLPAVIFVLTILSIYGPRLYKNLKYKKLPPGPHCIPLLGYLPFFNRKTAHLKLSNLAKKYGNVFGLYVGTKYLVILDNFQAVKASFNKDELIYRPDGAFEISDGQPSILDINGNEWKEQRRFFGTCLRLLATGNNEFERVIMTQISEVSESLIRSSGKTVNLNHELENAINNISFNLMYGKRFDSNHPLIHLLSDYDAALQVHFLHSTLKLFFPLLAYLMELTPHVRKSRKVQSQVDEILRKEIIEHQETINRSDPRDLIDFFLLHMEKPGVERNFNLSTLLGNLKTFLGASSETTRSTLVWFLLLMAEYPDVQRRVQEEIDFVIGREREPCYPDHSKLPFTEATILESMRFKNILHLNVYKMSSKDTTLCGFDIPKGTVIVHNMSSHFRNSCLFDHPDKFEPKRFLSQDGMKVQVPEYFIPFSYGKRNCIGDKTASMILFLFSTRLVQEFCILPPENGVNLDTKIAFTNLPSSPYVRLQKRS